MFGIQTRGILTPGQKVFQYKSPVHGRVVEFVPERGMISIYIETTKEGKRSEEFERVNCSQFLLRIQALNANVQQMREDATKDSGRAKRHWQEAMALQNIVDCMYAALQEARRQGDPFRTLQHVPEGQTSVQRPLYETPIAPIPVAPSSKPFSPTVTGVDPSRVLILPPSFYS